MTTRKNISKSRINYYVDLLIIPPFLLLIITGLFMLAYHSGKPYPEAIIGKNGNFWLSVHQVLAFISFVMIAVHLYLHFSWIKKLFSGKLKNKYRIRNLALFILFFATTLTSVLPWLILGESDFATLLLGLHNKIGLLLIIFLIIHLYTYFGWLFRMTVSIVKCNKSTE